MSALVLTISGLPEQVRAADEDAASTGSASAPTTMFSRAYLQEVWERETLFGDWLGMRKNLMDNGIYPKLRMSHYYQESTSGGIRDHGEYLGKMDYRADVDLNKLAGTWPGLYASVHAESRWGQTIGEYVGPFNLPNANGLWPLPGDYSGTQVTQLVMGQALPTPIGRFDVLAGKLSALDLVTTIYPHVASGQEAFMNVNSLVTAWPWFRFVNLVMYGAAAWISDDQGRIQGGLIAFGQDNVSTTWQIDESFEDGVGLLGFYRYFWEIDGKVGSLAFFAGGATKQYQALEDTDWSPILGGNVLIPTLGDRDRRPWAIAPYLYQELWSGEQGQKIFIFTGGSYAREDPSFADWHYFASIEAFGAIPKRRGDRMGFAYSYNNLGKDLKDALDLIGIDARDHYSFEWYYNVEINKWLHVTANFQLLQNAQKGDNMAVVPGMRAVIDF
ncbi:MAG: carbohydrate porin [Deltaproteobacteria bacterium]|jgi:porin|nr:carbohydrate porin [Deltaproteobacteria bacterium]MBW2496509.1 carbohydrate porin [Deltaproteobacteria bacterium]